MKNTLSLILIITKPRGLTKGLLLRENIIIIIIFVNINVETWNQNHIIFGENVCDEKF